MVRNRAPSVETCRRVHELPSSSTSSFAGCVKLLPMLAEAWLRKSDAVLAQETGRKREVLMDYANALLIMDHASDKAEVEAAVAQKVEARRRSLRFADLSAANAVGAKIHL